MQSVVIQDVEWRDEFGKKLFELQQTGQFCDVIIKTVEDARLLVHSCVLAAASPLLKGVIESALNDTTLGTIMLSSDIDVNTWTHMLEFMYTGGATVPDSLVASLQSGATILKVDTLVERCNEILPTIVTKIEEPIPSETQDIYSAIAQIKEDNDAVVEQESVEGKIATEEGIMVMTTEAMVEGSIITQEDHAVESAEGIPDNTEATVIDDGGVQEADVGIAEEQDAVDETAVVPETHETLDAQDAMDTQDYIDDVHDAPLDFIATPVPTVVAAVPASTDDGYKAALEVLMASNMQPNLTHIRMVDQLPTESLSMDITSIKTEVSDSDIEANCVRKDLEFEVIGFSENGKHQYRCCLCNTLCMDPSAHKSVHTEDRPYICTYDGCGKAYKSKPALKQHFSSSHTELCSHTCIKCGKSFKTEYLLKKHAAVACNDSRPFVCRKCGKSFKTLAKLQYHEGTHAEVKPYQCNVCLKPMASKAHLKVHMVVHSEGNFSCFCGKTFKSAKRYQEHYKLIHDPNNPYRCSICHRNFKNLDSLNHHKESHTRPFSCRVCKKGFRQILSCRMHERIKHKLDEPPLNTVGEGNENTVCPVCGKDFKNNHSMEIHLTVHMLEDIFPCPTCGKKFKLQKHLVSHMAVHGDRDLPCPKCDKKFKHEKNLKIHLNSHLKPFQCTYCGARFANERYLKTHLERHKKGAPPKHYRCPYCEVVCPSLSNVKIHMEEVHPEKPKVSVQPETPLSMLSMPKTRSSVLFSVKSSNTRIYNCEICHDTFDQENGLTKHEMQKHVDADRIPCTECGVKFLTSRTMKTHLFKEHGVGEQQRCVMCDREFFDGNDLEQHKLVVHDKKVPPIQQLQSYRIATENKVKNTFPRSKVYLCILCLKRFFSAKALQKHEVIHEKDEYVCRVCKKVCQNLNELKDHCLHCSDTTCVYCCQEFANKQKLKKHITFHQIGNVMYKCSQCDLNFSDVSKLKSHKETHFLPSENDKSQSSSDKSFKSLLSGFSK